MGEQDWKLEIKLGTLTYHIIEMYVKNNHTKDNGLTCILSMSIK